MPRKAANAKAKLSGILRRAKFLGGKAPDLIAFLIQQEAVLVQNAHNDPSYPPIVALTDDLLQRFDREWLCLLPIRQLIGSAVAALMRDNGFVASKKPVRFRQNPIFVSSLAFHKPADAVVSQQESDNIPYRVYSIFYRMLDRLTGEELAMFRKAMNELEKVRKLSG
jgi:hypothetical protein